jgi:hypothetical protein
MMISLQRNIYPTQSYKLEKLYCGVLLKIKFSACVGQYLWTAHRTGHNFLIFWTKGAFGIGWGIKWSIQSIRTQNWKLKREPTIRVRKIQKDPVNIKKLLRISVGENSLGLSGGIRIKDLCITKNDASCHLPQILLTSTKGNSNQNLTVL